LEWCVDLSDLLARPLILGGRGQLGTDLRSELHDLDPIVPERSEADLENHVTLSAMLERWRPTVVINAAAYTNVDQSEVYPEKAFAVNALGVDALARACAAAGTILAHVSTDYVFSGRSGRPYTERDEPEPSSAYGISKLAGELLLRRYGERWFIFRTSGLYGVAGSSGKGYTFIDKVLSQAAEGKPVRVVDDMTFSPSYTMHVANAIRRVIETGRFGLYHLTNAGACTWFEFAREAFALSGIRVDFAPIKTSDFPSRVARPMYSALAHDELLRAGLDDLPNWRVGLRDYLDARKRA
jgi:dTDP-4-dehydrorhamnose reductase